MMTMRRRRGMKIVMTVMVVTVVVSEVKTMHVTTADPSGHHLGEAVGQVVRQHLDVCHLVVATWHRHSPALDYVLRWVKT